jgi:hypothetical protein
MSDTVIAYRNHSLRISASLKACLLYVIADACVSLGQELSSMDHTTWDKMWSMQRIGFWLSQIGSTALMVKAFYSGSSPKNNQPKDTTNEPNPIPDVPPAGPAV